MQPVVYRLLEAKLDDQETHVTPQDLITTLRNMNVTNIHDVEYMALYNGSRFVCVTLFINLFISFGPFLISSGSFFSNSFLARSICRSRTALWNSIGKRSTPDAGWGKIHLLCGCRAGFL